MALNFSYDRAKCIKNYFNSFSVYNVIVSRDLTAGALPTYTKANIYIGSYLLVSIDTESTYSLKEKAVLIQKSLPPLVEVFGKSGIYNPRAYFSNWQKLWEDQSIKPLSFQKSQDSFLQTPQYIERWFDIDSLWFRPTSLVAIKAPNDFYIVLLLYFSLNLSSD